MQVSSATTRATKQQPRPAVDGFAHKSWKTASSLQVGVWNPSSRAVQVVTLSTREMGQRCHELDQGIRVVETTSSTDSNGDENEKGTRLRPVDRDGKRRPLQPGELPLTTDIDNSSSNTVPGADRPWYVPFCIMPNMNGHGHLFDRWEALVLQLVNDHRLPGTTAISDLAQAHQVLPLAGTKAFGMDLHLQVQRWLADRLTAEWNGQDGTPVWLDLYTETIRLVVEPILQKYYNCRKFYVQKHPKNLRLQMPDMKSVQHWHCDSMFGHPQGEINFSLCLTEFRKTAGICLEMITFNSANDKLDYQVFPILAGAGSIVVAPFGYCPHGNLLNTEVSRTRVSIDWRVIPVEDLQAQLQKTNLGASATSGLPYVPGAYYGLWDGGWVDCPKTNKPSLEPAATE